MTNKEFFIICCQQQELAESIWSFNEQPSTITGFLIKTTDNSSYSINWGDGTTSSSVPSNIGQNKTYTS